MLYAGFLTANPKLRSEVAKQFHKLRAAVLHDPEEAKRLEELSNQDYPILDQIPLDAFPLFWTTPQTDAIGIQELALLLSNE